MAPLPRRTGKVAVIGGGIGGLAAATALAHAGADVSLYEQAPGFREVGAGIQITPNGGRVLSALGLDGAAAAVSLAADAVEPIDAMSGRRIARFDLGGRMPPYRFFHRADLIDILAEAARHAGVTVHLGEQIAARSGVLTSASGPIEAELIVGADGLHSVVRPLLNGPDAPFFTGQVAWRAVIDARGAERVARIWMAPGKHVVTYPLTHDRLNIVAVQERRDWTAEGWHRPADPAVLRHAFHDLSGRLTGLLAQVDSVMEWGLFRHPIAHSWTDGRLALLGDAAHPTLPFLAQGANLALEDAWVLARMWAAGLLAGYAAARRPRTQRAIAAANANAANYHLAGLRRTVAHAALRTLSRAAPGAFLGRLSWLYDHDVTA